MTRTNPETKILRAVRDYLRIRGFYVVRNLAGIGCHPGLADLTAIKGSRVVMIEVKTATGRLSSAQETFRDEWTHHGGEYVVVRDASEVAGL